MKLQLTPKLPYSFGTIVENYLKLFKPSEKYVAYSIDEDYEIVKGIGTIENDGSWDNHKNEDNSEDRLYFIPDNRKARWPQWWTVSLQEVTTLQHELITQALLQLKEIEAKLEQLKSQKL